MQNIKTTGENCTGKSKLTSEVRRMCYSISRGKNSKKPYLKQLELISNFNGSSKKEVSKWREIFQCILDVVLFLSEQQLPFCRSTTELNNPNNGLFLGNLELLSGHNQILKSHLDEVKNIKKTTAECKRIIYRHIHKTNLLMNILKLFSMLLWKKLSKHCTIKISENGRL